ncbi:MAG: glutaredoxin family protein [Candidatus Thermoplasmatota archaeon]|nr:glutaredoxin family protein [Euryarchaeota archaeon]MBU4033058.1 glutaredoxin family protein [Candidatus Thermoplasmatota archaeon]MBU4072104.1 glutaredoxin family protein [Candidatus Thermoplasmatota archaeon]MBU4143687.1 glutaredoxin family protein [Candidatus Thermoplasmatota archaeon]MBU4591799.1 glutaredoxin family protein [Candidatus Thermoplasmatota archaeon]
MKYEHIGGINKGKVMLFALSTCVWCKRTKQLLNTLGVEYDYIFVDQLQSAEKQETMGELEKWNPRCSFPTLVINDDKCIVGFKEDEIRAVLG